MSTRAELSTAKRAARWAKLRLWFYGVCIAAVPVALYFGWMPPEAAPVILPLVLAILNVPKEAAA